MILLKNPPYACCKLSARATVSDDGDGAVRDWLNGAALLELVKMLGCLGPWQRQEEEYYQLGANP